MEVTCNEVTVTSYFLGKFTDNCTFFYCNDNVVIFFNNSNEFYNYFYRYLIYAWTRFDYIQDTYSA